MADLFKEFIDKPHRSVEDVLGDICEMELYEDEILEDEDSAAQLEDLLRNIRDYNGEAPELPVGDQPVLPDDPSATPDMPDLTTPDAGVAATPDMPDLGVPDAGVAPEPGVPDLTTPDAGAVPTPDMPDLTTPDAGVAPEPGMPDLTTPDAGATGLPGGATGTPDLNIPGAEPLPSGDASTIPDLGTGGDIPGLDAPDNMPADMPDPAKGLDPDNPNPPEEEEPEEEDPEDSDDPEVIKRMFVNHVQELVKFRDILDDLINKTADDRFTKVRKLVITVIDAIAKEGQAILTNPKLKQINKDLSMFLIDAVGKVKQIVDAEYTPTDTNVDMDTEIQNMDDAEFGDEPKEEKKPKAKEGGASDDVPVK